MQGIGHQQITSQPKLTVLAGRQHCMNYDAERYGQ